MPHAPLDVPRFVPSCAQAPTSTTCFDFIWLLFLSTSWSISTSALLSGWRSMANGAFGERIRMDCDETSDAASARGWTGCRGELRRLTNLVARVCATPQALALPRSVGHSSDPVKPLLRGPRAAETSRDSVADGPAMPKCRHRATMTYGEHVPPGAVSTTWHRSSPDPDSRTTLRCSNPIHSREAFSRG